MAKPWRAGAASGGLFFFYLLLLLGLERTLGLATLAPSFLSHWQFLDRQTLLAEPLASLLQLHAQPPLLNVIVWLLSLLPSELYANFIVLNAACMAATGVILYRLLSPALASAPARFAVSTLFVIAPITLQNVAYPFYPCLTSLGYAMLVYALQRALQGKRSLYLFAFAVLYLSLLRSSVSLLHVLFFCGLYYACLLRAARTRSTHFAIALLVVCCMAVPAKNYVMYGFFGSSSWAPINLAKGFAIQQAEGYFISPAALHARYPDLKCMQHYGFQDTSFETHEGRPNYNHCLMIPYAERIGAGIPDRYRLHDHACEILKNSLAYFAPPSAYHFLPNRAAIAAYADMVDGAWLTVSLTQYRDVRLVLLVILSSAIMVSLVRREPMLRVCVVLFLCHYLSHVLTDGSESQRFVFDLEFLFYLLPFLTVAAWRAPQIE